MTDKLKKPQTFILWAQSDYAEMIAVKIQSDINRVFGMLPNVKVGGFDGDDERPIRVYYFGSNTELQTVKKFISDNYDLGIEIHEM